MAESPPPLSPSETRYPGIHQLSFGDHLHPLEEGRNIIGRGKESNVVVDAAGVSRRHACITIQNDQVLLEDLGSKNGTFVSSRRVDAPVEISDSCPIRLGTTWLVYHNATAFED